MEIFKQTTDDFVRSRRFLQTTGAGNSPLRGDDPANRLEQHRVASIPEGLCRKAGHALLETTVLSAAIERREPQPQGGHQ